MADSTTPGSTSSRSSPSGSTSSDSTSSRDGRRARRERTRIAVVDAAFALITAGKVPPAVEQVAELAGVSVSTIFRNFDGLDDLHRQAYDRFQDRYAHLVDVTFDGAPGRTQRIERFVRARLELLAAAGPLMRVARQRALDSDVFADGVARSRSRLADQTRNFFEVELRRLTAAEAANLASLIDVATSPEALELAGAAHARTPRQLAATWTRALEALITDWCGPEPDGDPAS